MAKQWHGGNSPTTQNAESSWVGSIGSHGKNSPTSQIGSNGLSDQTGENSKTEKKLNKLDELTCLLLNYALFTGFTQKQRKTRQFPKWSNFYIKTLSPLKIFVLGVFVFSEIEMVMINWKQNFLSSISVCDHTRDKQIGLPLRGRLILLITRMITGRKDVSVCLMLNLRCFRFCPTDD